MSRQVYRDKPVMAVERGPEEIPRLRGAGESVQQHDRRPIAALGDVEAKVVTDVDIEMAAHRQCSSSAFPTALTASRCSTTFRARSVRISTTWSPLPLTPVATAARSCSMSPARV